MTSRESYERYCASVGVKPMPENEWAAYSDNNHFKDVAGFFTAAAKAAQSLNNTPHDDRAINPIPHQQPQQIACRPTRTIRQRDFHARGKKQLHALLLQLQKAPAEQARQK